jgi:branched-chain amino acid transport system permease protein
MRPRISPHRLAPAALPCAIVVAVSLLVASGSAELHRTVVLGLVDLVIVVGLYCFVGGSGVFSFGHMSFMSVGAYTAALLTMPEGVKSLTLSGLPHWLAASQLPGLPATLVGGGIAAIVALALAVPLMRLSGMQAGLATLAVLIITYVVASNWSQVTGGGAGLSPVPATTSLGVALAWAIAAIVGAWLFQESPLGLRLRASREDAVAARSLGVSVFRERMAALVLSAFIVGVGGALYAGQQLYITPDQFYISITFLTIAMLVVGGMNSLAGAVVGSIVVAAIQEVLRRIEAGANLGFVRLPSRPGLTEVGLGVLLLLMLMLRPEGITHGREFRLPRRTTSEGTPSE